MSNLRPLNEILNEYKQAEKFSKQNPEAFPISARAGIEVRINQSKAKLPKLRLEYVTSILKSSFGFFLEGEDEAKKDAFTKIAVESGAVVVDADAVFQKLADVTERTMEPSREFSVTQISLMDHALREMVETTGYDGTLNRTVITDLRVVSDRPRLLRYIRELVARSNGSIPVTVKAQSDIVSQAIAKEFSGKRLVVIVRNASATTRAPLAGIFTRTHTVDVDSIEQVNEETAAVIFREGLGLTKAS